MLWNTQTTQLWEAKVKNHPLKERNVGKYVACGARSHQPGYHAENAAENESVGEWESMCRYRIVTFSSFHVF